MIQLQNITLTIKLRGEAELTVLDQISMSLEPGSFNLIKGPSGSGKSSLLSLMAGLRRPTHGDVLLDGQSISKIPDHFAAEMRRASIGFIFQKFHLVPGMTVQENIELPLMATKLSTTEVQARSNEWMNRFALHDLARTQSHLLSGGEQQRVAIARALINDPDLILADEPTTNLDHALFDSFLAYMDILKERNATLVLASHDPRFESHGRFDRVYHMEKGRILGQQ